MERGAAGLARLHTETIMSTSYSLSFTVPFRPRVLRIPVSLCPPGVSVCVSFYLSLIRLSIYPSFPALSLDLGGPIHGDAGRCQLE